MNPNDTIESYVADVIRRVPLKERNDIGFELRALLSEMLDERAEAAGKPADDAMVLAMLREFGLPADIAARYRAPGFVIIPAEQTRQFAWLSLGGIALQWALTLPRVAEGQSLTAWWLSWGLGAFWWPGFMSMMALIAAWIRQWRTAAPAWSPRDVDSERVNRAAMAFGLVGVAIAVTMMIAMPWIVAQLPAPFPRIFAFDPDFLRTRAWPIVVLWLAHLALMGWVLAKGRWSRATHGIELAQTIAWIMVLGWLLTMDDIFIERATNDGAHFGLGLVLLIVVWSLAVSVHRMRPRLQAPNVAARH
ncbi:putative membrane protein [Lysobacter dokdonensis DS-58]|uniref:Putative membrane protein n=1 Tax=Lysobacter dokdonensis DS-58 TaxID=1300345 RepID=A0A0A2WIX8_9GAMM|nr:hypothetical protein [Lysobacter dokdonensis]KGQ18190.1 putative membrane protein [Lysobacter dokdonensis DS-58]